MSTAAFKEAMSRFASGVTVVCGSVSGELHGMTVAAFASVSAEPPIVLVSLGVGSRLGAGLAEGDAVSVSVLAASEAAHALRFAGMDGHAGDRFEGVATEGTSVGVPAIAGSVATLAARVRQVVAAGDHRVFFLDVQEVRVSEEHPPPLLWWSRGFAGVAKR
jgi:flavin reductase (DIM6/NTAB) family NADH-FMN oxidoreductase RutF